MTKTHKRCNGFVYTVRLDCVCTVIYYDENHKLLSCNAVLAISKNMMKFTKRERFETSVIVNVICLYLLALRRATYIRKFRKDEMTSCRIFFFISSGSILGPSPSNLSILNTILGDFTLRKAYSDLRLQKHGRSGGKRIIKPEIRLLQDDSGRRTRRDKPNEVPMGEVKIKTRK